MGDHDALRSERGTTVYASFARLDVSRSIKTGNRFLLLAVLAGAWTAGFSRPAHAAATGTAAAYPERTVTIVCPWSAGGGTDRVSRFWAQALQDEFGMPFVVVNRTGGAGAVGHFSGAHASPDGHTIAMITFELSTMHRMRISRLTYQDYECLLQVNADPAAIIVRTEAPWQSLSELLDEIRARPGEIKMSGTATGGAWDLARAGLLQAAEIPIQSVVWVPHPGAAPSLMELMGGHIDVVCCSVPEVASQLESGQVRVLCVMNEGRMEDYPEFTTAQEQGVDWVAVGWRGLALPKGTPQEIVALLAERCERIAKSDAYREFMRKNGGFGIKIRTTTEFTDFLEEQDQQWKRVVEAAGYDKGLTGNDDPGPLALPIALLIGLVAVGGWELVRDLRRRGPTVEGDPSSSDPADQPPSAAAASGWKLWLVALALIVYVAAIAWIGFVSSTFLFMTITTWALGARWWAAVLASAIVIGVVWLLFVLAFDVQLPAGLLGSIATGTDLWN